MIRDAILKILKKNHRDLTTFHVKALYLFGSVARGEEKANSDIDVLVVFDGPATFDSYMELKFYLEELFKKRVDLVTETSIRPEIRKNVQEDLIRAA